jgi:hypothetical protein
VKINDSGACTQELICGGEVQILQVKLGPLRCFMSIGMEHSGECSHKRPIAAVSDMIGDTCLILDVEMELLQVGGPLMMVVIFQFSLCLQEHRWLMIGVDDSLLPENVISPLQTNLHNGVHLFFISRVLMENI